MQPDDGRFQTVGELADALDRAFPLQWADPWDRVGLIVGEPATPVRGVMVTLDATGAAVLHAAEAGANVLVTHHPPYLEPPARPEHSPGPRGTVAAALAHGVAVIALHTCLDRSPAGAEALPRVLGLTPGQPLESGVEEVSLVTAFVPEGAADAVRAAMAEAGAGRLGHYEGAAFAGAGTAHFEPLAGASPAVAPRPAGVGELRLEMVCAREAARRVVEAARRVHPYEEPVIIAVDGVRARGVARYGRVCTWDRAQTVAGLARHVDRTLGVRCRIWGDPARQVTRIGTANGSGSSLLRAAVAAADVLVTGEVRYHDALDAVADGLAIIEAGHDATEWPLVNVLASAVIDAVVAGVPVTAERAVCAWRTTEDVHDGS